MNLKLDIELARGEFKMRVKLHSQSPAVGVFGPSGCGKTTLLRVIAGLSNPDSGRIQLNGVTLYEGSSGYRVPAWKRRIGTVFQDVRLFPHRSVRGNILAGMRSPSQQDFRYGIGEVVDLLGITHLTDRSIHDLSGGEAQRVAIARTLMTYPRLLLMDEPTASLDRGVRSRLLAFIRLIHDSLGVPVIMVSHDLQDIQQLTNEMVLMEQGRLLMHGSLTHLLKNKDGLQCFAGSRIMNIVEGRVVGHQADRGFTQLLHDSGEALYMRKTDGLESAARVRVGVAANDIILARKRHRSVSARNQLEVRVQSIVETDSRTLCFLESPIGTLFAEVIPQSREDMSLRPGSRCVAMFKALSVDLLSGCV